MEDRGLRDIERWRDKIEVRLDNRQVFFLFFGSALVACMLFVLGVIVGKRLESRGRAVSPEIEDPLALLDKVATTPRLAQGGVTFPQALFGTAGKSGAADKHAKKSLASTGLAKGSNDESAKPSAHEAQPAAASAKALPAASDNKSKADKPEAKAALAIAEPKSGALKSKPTEIKPAEAKTAAKEEKPIPVPTVAAGGDSKSKGHFSLQLSSFQSKAEAEAFAQKFASEHPYMVMSDIPGKGIWYRVRVGDYVSMKDAMAAKESFEKKHSVIAYVAQK